MRTVPSSIEGFVLYILWHSWPGVDGGKKLSVARLWQNRNSSCSYCRRRCSRSNCAGRNCCYCCCRENEHPLSSIPSFNLPPGFQRSWSLCQTCLSAEGFSDIKNTKISRNRPCRPLPYDCVVVALSGRATWAEPQ